VTQTELGYLDSKWDGITSFASGYLSVGHRFDAWLPYAMVAAAQPRGEATSVTAPDPSFDELAGAVTSFYQGARISQRTVSLGARWDCLANVALKLQLDHTTIDRHGGGLWWNDNGPVAGARRVTTFSANLNFVF